MPVNHCNLFMKMTWRNLIQATGLWRGGEVKAESRRSCSRAVRLSLGCGPGSSAHLVLRTQMLLPRMFPVSQSRIFHMFLQQRQHYQNISNFWRLAAAGAPFKALRCSAGFSALEPAPGGGRPCCEAAAECLRSTTGAEWIIYNE